MCVTVIQLSIPRWYAEEGASISIKRVHLTPGSGVLWLGTTSVAPAQVKRGVGRQPSHRVTETRLVLQTRQFVLQYTREFSCYCS